MPKRERPSTMRSLAAELGISVMTVSRALRNAAEVNPATRKRVLDAARRQGYRPDPVMSALAEYRRALSPQRPPRESLAFLTNFSTPDGWREQPTFNRYFEGASARASELGYQIAPFWMGDPELTPKRVSQILVERGVRGLVVGPLPTGNSAIELDWRRFSVVCLGRSLKKPALSQVCPHHSQIVKTAVGEALARGYRRIGLVLSNREDERTVHAVRTAFVFEKLRHGHHLAEPLVHADDDFGELRSWAERERLDLLMTCEATHVEQMIAAGTRGRSLKILHLNVSLDSGLPGMDQVPNLIGEHAVGLLHLKLLQRQTGLPENREILMIEGIWREGRGRWKLRAKSR